MGLFMSKEDKKQLKLMKEEEKRLEAELPDEKVKLVDLLFQEDEEDLSLEEALPENERAEIEAIKSEEKKLLIRAMGAFSGIFFLLIIGLIIFQQVTKSDLLKTTLPLFSSYYQEHYQKDLKYNILENICDKEECSTIAHLETKNGEHLMAVSNKELGDDVTISKIEEAYSKTLENALSSIQVIHHYPTISYQNYFMKYNPHLLYSKALPHDKTFNDYLKKRSLIIQDVILYQGNLDFTNIRPLLSLFNDKSIFYFVGQTNGIPSSLTVLSKEEQITFPITANIPIEEGTIYELDRNLNAVTSINISRVSENDIHTIGDYTLTSSYAIKPEIGNQNRDNPKPQYYFFKLDNTAFDIHSVYEFSLSSYQEYEREEYVPLAIYQVGNSSYLIGKNAIGVGVKKENQGFWCKFGFC